MRRRRHGLCLTHQSAEAVFRKVQLNLSNTGEEVDLRTQQYSHFLDLRFHLLRELLRLTKKVGLDMMDSASGFSKTIEEVIRGRSPGQTINLAPSLGCSGKDFNHVVA